MRCQNCGKWNRANLPRCFYCGAPLEVQTFDAKQNPEWLQNIKNETNVPTVYIEQGDEGEQRRADERDRLAIEMSMLRSRRDKGEEHQRILCTSNQRQDYTSPNRQIQTYSSRENFLDRADRPIRGEGGEDEPENQTLPENRRSRTAQYWGAGRRADRYTMSMRMLKGRNPILLRRRIRLALIVLMLAGVVLSVKYLVINPTRAGLSETQAYGKNDIDILMMALGMGQTQVSGTADVLIYPSILNDMAAHTVEIPGKEGAQIYVKNLNAHYVVMNGYATLEIPDHFWYDDMEGDLSETMTVTLTPYLVESEGAQRPLAPISYDISIPLSPIALVTPSTSYQEVSTTIYKISFIVNKGSTVIINGDDYSDLVNTQDGIINYNASVKPVGNNYVDIEVRAQYYRKNSVRVTLYRPAQDIPINLMTTISDESSYDYMNITATTLPGDTTIRVTTPHSNLNTETLATNGTFSFKALFTRVGVNTISIEADYPGLSTSYCNFEVYYLPPADKYTVKAWGLDSSTQGSANYREFLSNTARRVNDAQIYVCTGTIVRVISESPQLAIIECGTDNGSMEVMLENQTKSTWTVGTRYRIFADAYGTYNGIPRLIARYTYTTD